MLLVVALFTPFANLVAKFNSSSDQSYREQIQENFKYSIINSIILYLKFFGFIATFCEKLLLILHPYLVQLKSSLIQFFMEVTLNFVVSFLNFGMNKIRCFFNILFNSIMRLSQI